MGSPSPISISPPTSVALEDVILASALRDRAPHAPDFARECEAFHSLGHEMANRPEDLLDRLADVALDLCEGGSSGVSLLETTPSGEQIFRWVTLAGAAAPHVGGSTPADWSPCGTCLAHGEATLFTHPERHFTYFQQLGLPIIEGLVVPLRSSGRDIGTIWVMTHVPGRGFDREDVRVLEGLGAFTSGALALHQALRQSEETARLRAERATLVDWSSDGLVGLSLEGVILAWNPAASRIYGYSAEEAIGRPFSFLTPPGSPEVIDELLPRVREQGQVSGFITEGLHRDGRQIEVEINARAVLSDAGRPTALVAAIRDVTERRRAEVVAQHLAAIVESSDDAIIGKDLNGVIHSWNKGAERIFGYTAEEIIGKPVTVLAVPERVEEIPNILARIKSGTRVEHYETQRRTKDGRVLDVSLTVSPIRGASGAIVGASKIARDVTDQKRAEEELRAANRELEQFAFVASHDLKEPLRMVNSYAQLLLRRMPPHDPQLDEYANFIRTGVLRMETLLDDLLLFSRVIHGERRIQKVRLEDVLAETLSMLDVIIGETGASITCDALPVVMGDPSQLGQVLQNLIGNSLKYRNPNARPEVHVGAAREGSEWLISVRDNGLGFRMEYAGQIFGLFKRLHRHDIPGTGIGLAICRRVIERHGGRIWAESPGEGKGATFRFTLPAHERASIIGTQATRPRA